MNPNGISADMTLFMGEHHIFYLGEPDSDGYSQVVQFELKATDLTTFFFSSDDDYASLTDATKSYRFPVKQGKIRLTHDGDHVAQAQWTNVRKYKQEEFKSYVFR